MSKRPGCEDYEPSQDFAESMPGDNPQAIGDLVKAVRQGIKMAKLDGSALAADDVARMPGRFLPDYERKMWTECVHGVALGKPCKKCEDDPHDLNS